MGFFVKFAYILVGTCTGGKNHAEREYLRKKHSSETGTLEMGCLHYAHIKTAGLWTSGTQENQHWGKHPWSLLRKDLRSTTVHLTTAVYVGVCM